MPEPSSKVNKPTRVDRLAHIGTDSRQVVAELTCHHSRIIPVESENKSVLATTTLNSRLGSASSGSPASDARERRQEDSGYHQLQVASAQAMAAPHPTASASLGKASPMRRVGIHKPGKAAEQRPLSILTIEARARQPLFKLALEPQWEAKLERRMRAVFALDDPGMMR